jgi:hypothetical protein
MQKDPLLLKTKIRGGEKLYLLGLLKKQLKNPN